MSEHEPVDLPDEGDDDWDDELEPAAGPPAPLWAKIGTAVVGLVLLGFVLLLATSDDGDGTGRVDSPLVDRVVPPLVGTTLDGSQYDIDDDRGRWVVVNFFASWCIPCEVEHPEFIEFSERHADGSAQVVSVLFGDTAENAQRFFDERGGDWPVIVDADTAPADFVVLQVPETFLVAPSGLVVGKWEGEITADQIDGAIDALLAVAG